MKYCSEEILIYVALCLQLFILGTRCESNHIDNTNSFIRDFLKSQTKAAPPTPVSAFLCWKLGDILKIIKFLSQNQILLSVHSTTENVLSQYEPKNQLADAYNTFVLDLDCEAAHQILMQGNITKMLRRQNKWLLLRSPFYNITQELSSRFGKLVVLLDSDVTVAFNISKRQYDMYEVYWRGHSEIMVVNNIGYWEESSGICMNTSRVVAMRRINFHQATVKAVTVVTVNDSINHLEDGVNKKVDTVSKCCYMMFKIVLDMLNARADMVFTNTWGINKNGSWTDLSGYLQRNETDIATTGMFVLKERMKVVDHIAPCLGGPFFIFRKPPLSLVENIFTLPFSRMVWISCAVLMSILATLLYGVYKWEVFKSNQRTFNKDNAFLRSDQPSVSDVVLLTLGTICQQGSALEAQQPISRMVTLWLYITVIFLYTAYTAFIITLLQSSTNSIQTLKDLYESGMELAVWDTPYNRHFFTTADEPLKKAIYENRIKGRGRPDKFLTIEEGTEKVRKGLFAFHSSFLSFHQISETYQEEEKCDLELVKYFENFCLIHVATSKETPFKEIFKIGYRRLAETGLQLRTQRSFYLKKPQCEGRGSFYMSVGITDCYPILLAFVYGVACSILAFITEIVVNNRLRRREIERLLKQLYTK